MIENISFSEYRARPGLNSHYLKDLLRNPAYAKWNKEHDRDTPTLAFGRAFHAAVLEPAELLTRFTVAPEDMDRRTKAGKAMYEDLQKSGKTILSCEDMFRITSMNHSLRQHAAARKLLGEVEYVERSVFWEMSGLACKSRLDAVAGTRIIDIKTCQSAEKRKFERDIVDYGYFQQAAFYLESMYAHNQNVNEFVFIAIESQAPHGIAVYSLDQGFIDAGRAKIEEAFAIHKQCVKEDRWPSYAEEVQSVLCPAWLAEQEFTNA